MKNILFLILAFILMLSCSQDAVRNRNPFLPDYSFSIPINTNLPLYSGLNSAINPIIINDAASGVGIIVMKISSTDYRAWDVLCPNQYPTACSRMTINGINAKCECDAIEYSIFTGIGSGNYTMKPYRVEVTSDTSLRVYN